MYSSSCSTLLLRWAWRKKKRFPGNHTKSEAKQAPSERTSLLRIWILLFLCANECEVNTHNDVSVRFFYLCELHRVRNGRRAVWMVLLCETKVSLLERDNNKFHWQWKSKTLNKSIKCCKTKCKTLNGSTCTFISSSEQSSETFNVL